MLLREGTRHLVVGLVTSKCSIGVELMFEDPFAHHNSGMRWLLYKAPSIVVKKSSKLVFHGSAIVRINKVPVWINMRPKQSLKTKMTHFLSWRTGMTHPRKFEDRL